MSGMPPKLARCDTTCINRHYQKAVQVHVIQNRVMLVSFLYFDIDKNQRRGTCLLVLSVVIGIALWLYNVHICHCDILTVPLKLYRCFCNHCWFLSNFILFLIEIVSCATLAPDTKIRCQSKIIWISPAPPGWKSIPSEVLIFWSL